MTTPHIKTYQFESYSLEVEDRRILKDGVVVPFTKKRFEILLILIENAGQIVKKDLIMSRVWPGKVTEESNLSQHIFYLRRVFGKESPTAKFIMTIPGAGFMFYPQVLVTYEDGTRQIIGGTKSPDVASITVESYQVESEATADSVASSASIRSYSHLFTRQGATGLSIVLALLILAGFGGLYFYERKGAPGMRIQPTVVPFVTLPGLKMDMSFSPDGRMLAFGNEGDKVESMNLYLKSIDDDRLTRLTAHPGNDHNVAWSPDNREIAFLRWTGQPGRKNLIMIISVTGGREREIGEAWGGLDWSPDGRLLAISDNSEPQSRSNAIYLVNIDGSGRRRVSRPDPNENVIDGLPKFSPDGKSIAFIRWIAGGSYIFLSNIETGELRKITTDNFSISWIEWANDGKEIIFSANQSTTDRLWRISITGGRPIMIPGFTDEVNHFTISRRDQSLAFSSYFKNTSINVMPIDPSTGRQPEGTAEKSSAAATADPGNSPPPPVKKTWPCKIDSTRADDSSEFSPDGSKIAFMSSRNGFSEIWIANSDCSSPVQLTAFKQYSVGSPKWSPDGKWLAFDRAVKGDNDVFTIEISTRRVYRLTENKEHDYLPTWSHDGKWIYFCTDRFGASQIMKVPAEGGEQTQVTTDGGFESRASADGRYLYYTRNQRLCVKDLISGVEQVIPELAAVQIKRYWTLDRSSIHYVVRELHGRIRVNSFNLSNRQTTSIMDLNGWPSMFSGGFSVTADGRLLAISLIDYKTTGISLVRNWK
jgi:Tol biopolymer transport system component/DNA-binding winged helix-turn-helix (wHTH) protein